MMKYPNFTPYPAVNQTCLFRLTGILYQGLNIFISPFRMSGPGNRIHRAACNMLREDLRCSGVELARFMTTDSPIIISRNIGNRLVLPFDEKGYYPSDFEIISPDKKYIFQGYRTYGNFMLKMVKDDRNIREFLFGSDIE